MSKSQGGGTQEVVNKPWSQPQREAVNAAFKMAPDLLGTPQQYFPGSTVAGLGGQTQQALSGLFQQGMNGPGVGAATNANNATLGGQYLGANPYMQGAIEAAQRPTVQAYQTAIAPGIDSGFARAGRYGSGAHQNAVGQGQEQLARGLADSANTFSFGDYGRERGQMGQAAALAPGLNEASFGGLQRALGAGQIGDAQAQAQLSDEVNRFNFGQNEQYNRLARYMPLVSGNVGSLQTSPGQTTYTNPASTALGLGLGGAGIYSLLGGGGAAAAGVPAATSAIMSMMPAMMMSDRRVKEDVKRVGETDGGQPVYTYRYKGGGPTHMGVMAQEARGKNRKAVHHVGGGLLAVDYSEIT